MSRLSNGACVAVGLCLGIAVSLAAAGLAINVEPDQIGRFQMHTNQDFTYVLDTGSGQVWSVFVPEDGLRDPNDFYEYKAGSVGFGGGSTGRHSGN